MKDSHTNRVKNELKSVGVTRHGLAKSESRLLPSIIHVDEHIYGAIYGLVRGGSTAMLIATDHRVIFFDHQIFFTTTDELTYEAVSGVKSSSAGPFTSVVLHTRITDYTFRYVNPRCAQIFIKYIESKRLEKDRYGQQSTSIEEAGNLLPKYQNTTNDKAVKFLKERDLAVLSTVDRTGNVHGAVVYYLVDQDNLIYILTKSDTDKGRNIYAHNQIALTIHETGSLKTLQIQGIADIETDQRVKSNVFEQMVKPRVYNGVSLLPPVTKLQEGSYLVIRINPTLFKYNDFEKL